MSRTLPARLIVETSRLNPQIGDTELANINADGERFWGNAAERLHTLVCMHSVKGQVRRYPTNLVVEWADGTVYRDTLSILAPYDDPGSLHAERDPSACFVDRLELHAGRRTLETVDQEKFARSMSNILGDDCMRACAVYRDAYAFTDAEVQQELSHNCDIDVATVI